MNFYHMYLKGIPSYLTHPRPYEYLGHLSDFLHSKGVKGGDIFCVQPRNEREKMVMLRFLDNQSRDQAAKALNLSEFLGHTFTTCIVDPDFDETLNLITSADHSF